MIAVITGDIINSTKGTPSDWLPYLKAALNFYGKESVDWDIFRGDSFQLRLHLNEAINAVFYIKSMVKQSAKHDVRMAIGIGKEDYIASQVSESNGTVYLRSGHLLDTLQKSNLAIVTANKSFDNSLNIMFKLALLIADQWSVKEAHIVSYLITYPNKKQTEIAKEHGKSQSTISAAIKRSGFSEIHQIHTYYLNNLHLITNARTHS